MNVLDARLRILSKIISRKKNAPSGNCSITGCPVIFEPGSPGWEPEMLTATQIAQLDKKNEDNLN